MKSPLALRAFKLAALLAAFVSEKGQGFVPNTLVVSRNGLQQLHTSSPLNKLATRRLVHKPDDSVRETHITLQATKSPEQDEEGFLSPSPGFPSVAPLLGALVVLTGVALWHEAGHYLAARVIAGIHPEEFSVGFGPKVLGFQMFGDAFSLRAIPAGGYVRLNAQDLLALAWPQRILISSMGVIFNFLLSFAIFYQKLLFGDGLVALSFGPGVRVAGLTPDSVATGLLQPGDAIVALRNKPIVIEKNSPSDEESQRWIGMLISAVQATPEGKSLHLTVLPKDSAAPVQVSLEPKRIVSQKTGKLGPPSVGVILQPNIMGTERLQTDSATEAAVLASRYALAIGKEITMGLKRFFSDISVGKSSDYQIRGPVGVIEKATHIVATRDRTTVASYVAAMSINLGVINLIPIPPADGFQIAFVVGQQLLSHAGSQ